MKKTKYRYNPETLTYEKVSVSWQEKVLKGVLFVGPTILLTTILVLIIGPQMPSKKNNKLEKDNEMLRAELSSIQKEMENIRPVLADIQNRDDNIYRVIFEAEPYPEELRKLGTGGSASYENLDQNLPSSELVAKTRKKLEVLQKQLYSQSLSFDEVAKMAKEKETMLAALPAIQPVSNKDLTRVASGYGWRTDPIYKTPKMHWGMDFTSPTGTEIYATGNGVVESVEVNNWGYGKEIVVNHGYGYKTRYAHLSAFKVKPGQKVKRGEIIGLVGSTGKSTAPHLHYEVEKNGKKVNPVNYYHSDISPEQYEKLIELSNNANQVFD